MSLVNELQEVAESQDIMTVLRKAKRVSGKLNRNDILEWVKNEMEGYGANDVPKYRTADCFLVLSTNGYIHAGYGYLKSGIERVPHYPSMTLPIKHPISTLFDFIGSKNLFCLPIPHPLEDEIKRQVLNICDPAYRQVSLYMEVPEHEVKRILQAVRDVVLDWAIKLEQEGVLGEGHSFTDDEKEKAAKVQIILGDNAVVGAIGQGSTGDATVSEV